MPILMSQSGITIIRLHLNHTVWTQALTHLREINTITYGAKQISYITRQYWNELLKEIKQEQNTNTFRQNLKKHFFIYILNKIY